MASALSTTNTIFESLIDPAVVVAILGIIVGIGRFLIVKHNESKSANRALLSEITRLLRIIESHEAWWEGCKTDKNTDLPLMPFSTDVADAILKKWTEIHPSYIDSATRFYGYVKFLNRLQLARPEHDKLNKHDCFVNTYSTALKSHRKFDGKFDVAFRKYEVEKPTPQLIPLHQRK
jgi:hypothetical protein